MRNASCSRDISMLKTATGMLCADRRVLGDVERERRLAHRRAAGDDHEVAGLQAGRHLVEIGVAGADAGELPLDWCSMSSRSIVAPQHVAQRHESRTACGGPARRSRTRGVRPRRPARGRAAFALVGAGGDLAADADQLPQHASARARSRRTRGCWRPSACRAPGPPGRRGRRFPPPGPWRRGTPPSVTASLGSLRADSSAMPPKMSWWSRR